MRARTPPAGTPAAPRQLRCAIYTRVSSDQGLDQAFNSLDAQREAAQAYVKSQAHEGWRPVRERYDDGGFSGGSMERPALTRLIEAIQAKRIDVVVVYKVDRLTRSLTDFAKLVELFDGHGVSFVSVTQSFNTTSSMGRLTLNVLLSFAQFEREVTGERIRDKIAASKRKGIWVGGVIPFGYALRNRKLIIDEAEATIVRQVFARYLVLGSLPALQRELRDQGVVTRARAVSAGGTRGGVALTNGPLAYMLRNRVYLGELNHRGASYPGEHEPIIASDLFDAVQAQLDANRTTKDNRRQHTDALLTGLLHDDRNNRMSPSYAVKKGLRYRYYVSTALVQGRKADAGSVPRVAAEAIEAAVCEALATADPQQQPITRESLKGQVERITIGTGRITIALTPGAAASAAMPNPLTIAWSPPTHHRRREIIAMADIATSSNRPIRSEARSRLLAGIARARLWLDAIMTGRIADTSALAEREGISERAARQLLSLAFVAPDIVEAAASGTLPRGFGISRLTDLPLGWDEQRRMLGIAG